MAANGDVPAAPIEGSHVVADGGDMGLPSANAEADGAGSRRRGRGRGRGRGGDGERGPRDGDGDGSAAAPSDQVTTLQAGMENRAAMHADVSPFTAPFVDTPLSYAAPAEQRPVAESAWSTPFLTPEPAVAPAPIEAVEEIAPIETAARDEPVASVLPAKAAPTKAPTTAPYALPMDSLVAVAESAGLQWVNSDAAKIRSAQEAMASAPPAVRVAREIHRPEPADEGPLVLVETKKDLSQFKLPFERAGSDAPKA